MNTPQVVNSYLVQLETALRGVEPGVREEIVAGIREELDGLEATDAAARIEALGDPEFIAAEARAASPEPRAVPAPVRQSNAFPIFVAFVVMSGGLIFPLIGGILGLAMMCASRAWTRTEKLVAVLLPVVGTAVDLGISWIQYRISLQQTRIEGPSAGGFDGPSSADFMSGFSWHGSILISLGLFIIDGIWLLWRVLRRR